jgi:formylmethanofuran dehydrogenase subunit A
MQTLQVELVLASSHQYDAPAVYKDAKRLHSGVQQALRHCCLPHAAGVVCVIYTSENFAAALTAVVLILLLHIHVLTQLLLLTGSYCHLRLLGLLCVLWTA